MSKIKYIIRIILEQFCTNIATAQVMILLGNFGTTIWLPMGYCYKFLNHNLLNQVNHFCVDSAPVQRIVISMTYKWLIVSYFPLPLYRSRKIVICT